MADDVKPLEALKAYEDGKHRRYSLLFAVNGGAFTVAKLFTDVPSASVLGALTLRQLAIGMILFTLVMVVDIWMFGWNMRKTYTPAAFGWQGRTVLILLGFLMCAGWFLVVWGA